MSNTRPLVRSVIKNFLESQDEYHSRADVLRVIEEEAMLMRKSQETMDVFDLDPFQQFEGVKPQIELLKRIIRVKSSSQIRTGNDYCRFDAVVGFEKCNNLELTFRYERKRRLDKDGRISKAGFHIRYSIEMSVNHQQRENLVVVEVWAANNWPSIKKAVCVNQMMEDHGENDDGDGGWEDIEEDEDGKGGIVETLAIQNNGSKEKEGCPNKEETNAKRQKLSDNEEIDEMNNPSKSDSHEDSDEPDSYVAYLDPEILETFLELTEIKSDEMHEGTAFFLLMTFPFYEQEWDLVGYLLEEVFGDDEDE
uniref:Uncharacterized protein n=1 Tax=Pseudo-nitzschia australis TaxID=44445 RepID=A0A7S4EE63_9STRA|mmetsp:Transcript_195/g.477  ORF Transcript_195/g.477 Transcript_195/m.477 type:complete len:308 (+) Transcript_195:135-1058(+)|eukprot:CAMPEP_0168167996 /NCGR_PEP_ID=MMETSP0139_2-20121125/2834_1 /TAXON_ID=44445 /ORGANISM="Pseudo-nitzschia australis, Strain 10249 10 AB" /LENGTH=307 /DNA_ID=CAMNT_0008085249 /DNA_START=121 /DNA_END=1047 /DNA_ORIENTATION=+